MQAQIDENNATIARQNAATVATQGQQAAGLLRDKGQRLIAKQIVQQAARGASLSSQSFVDTVSGEAGNIETDAQVALTDAARKSLGLQMTASMLDYSARESRNAARMAVVGGILGVGGAVAEKTGAVVKAFDTPSTALTAADFSPGGSHEGWT
jgi:hypothetical protein